MSNEKNRIYQVSTRVGDSEKEFLTTYAKVYGFASKTGTPSLSMALYDIVQKFESAWSIQEAKNSEGCMSAVESAIMSPSKNPRPIVPGRCPTVSK